MTRGTPTIALGRTGERLAARHYEALGARVLDSNYRARAGEIDLVVALGRCTVFVEVKARTCGGMHPFDSITPAKQLRLRALAVSWLRDHPRPVREIRFEALGIVISHEGELVSLEQCEILM